MAKYVTIFLAVLFVGIAAFLGVYVFLDRATLSTEDTAAAIGDSFTDRFEESESSEALSKPLSDGLNRISPEGSFPLFMPSREEVRYYNAQTGEIRSRSLTDFSPAKTLATIEPGVQFISWSADGNEFIARYQRENIYYDINNQTRKKYPDFIKNPVFSPYNSEIAYVYFDSKTGEGSISVADPMIASYKEILKTRTPEWKLSWIERRMLSLISPMTDGGPRTIGVLHTDSKQLDRITDVFGIIETRWSPSANFLAYSYEVNGKTFSYLHNRLTGAFKEVLRTQARASKCAWDIPESFLYCAAPASETGTGDKLVRIQVSTALSMDVPLPELNTQRLEMSQVSFDPLGRRLLFKNISDGALYLLALPR